MPKCIINNNNEITHFWEDTHPDIPEDAVECDKVPKFKFDGDSPLDATIYFYKLVDGKVVATDKGLVFEAQEYARNRQYPKLGEQLDMLFHDMTAGKGTKDGEWYKAVAKVKTDNPKPTE